LILVGHGSTVNANSSKPLRQAAARLRASGRFGQALECFWKELPAVAETIEQATLPVAVIVPFFISEGYFSQTVIPEAFGFSAGERRRLRTLPDGAGQTMIYAKPIGVHPAMTETLLSLAQDVIRKYPFPRAPKESDISLFIAGHGAARDPGSRVSIEAQVQAIRKLGRYAAVHDIYIEEEPRIESFHMLAPTRHVVVAPFFASNGMHTGEDIPRILGEAQRIIETRVKEGKPAWRNPTEKKGKLIWLADSVGSHPAVDAIIEESAMEALEQLK
jgi:sirohydrochlorin cobaltochelatase